MRHVVGGRAALADKYAASTSEVGRFETDILSTKENLTTLMNLSGRWIDTVRERRPLKTLILDMDSSVSETYGSQEGTAYNGRGTAEQWTKEGKNAVKWTKLSCRTFKDYQTRLQLFGLADNLANFLRRLALPRDVKHWSLTTLREKLVKIRAKVTRHSRYVTFQLAEVAVTRNLFSAILNRIARLAIPPPIVAGHAE